MNRTWIAVFLCLALACAPSERQETSPASRLTRLGPGSLSALRDSFNRSADRARIILLLSPT